MQETSYAKMAESKLHENLKKLQVFFLKYSLQGSYRIGHGGVSDFVFSISFVDRMFCFIWQGINLRTTEMQDTARSFSSMAKELLKTAENDKRSS
jgi:hypothetical protein